jgi:hypothetical protein
MTDPGTALLQLAAASRREFVMCAPFAKEAVITDVIAVVPGGVEIVLYTRWRPDEVAAGVSDTEVLNVLRSRGGVVYLHDRLHAKFYRNEDRVLLGSANLTATALGWAPTPNLELLVESDFASIVAMERVLSVESAVATDQLAREVEEIAKLLPTHAIHEEVPTPTQPVDLWVPSLRMPSDLFTAYSSGGQSLTARSSAAAAIDLAVLDLPVGLDRAQFDTLVGHRVRQQPFFQNLDGYLDQPRRFGEVRQKISQLKGFNRAQAEDAWQTTMRWMLEFLPRRYGRDVYRNSEVFSIIQPAEVRR